MSILSFGLFFAILLVSGFIVGITSFGGNLFAIPLMAMFMYPRDAIVIGSISCIPLLLLVGCIYWRYLIWNDILMLFFSAIPGAFVGAWLLGSGSLKLILLWAGAAVAIFVFWQILADRLELAGPPVSRKLSLICGFCAGIMAGATGMGGPPLVFYAFWRHWGKETTVGGCAMANGLQMVACLPAQWHVGLYSMHLAWLSFWAAIAGVIGLILSWPCLRYLNVSLFRKIVLAMLALAAINLLLRGCLN